MAGPTNVYSPPAGALTDSASPMGMFFWGLPATANVTTPYPVIQQFATISDGTIVLGARNVFNVGNAGTAVAADFDGDGLADLITETNSANSPATFQLFNNLRQHPIALANPVNIPSPTTPLLEDTPPVKVGSTAVFRGTDLDGDGRQEILVCFPGATEGSEVYVVNADGISSTNLAVCPDPRYYNPTNIQLFADFNNDGLDDYLANENSNWSRQWTMKISKDPIHEVHEIADPVVDPASSLIATIDYNLDDHPDLLVTTPGQSIQIATFQLSDFTAPTIFAPTSYGSQIVSDKNNAVQIGDLDGNGLSDFVVVEGGRFVAYLRQGNKPDMLTRVVDGMGSETRFSYQPISDSAVYTPAVQSVFSYPLRAVNSGVWVVSEEQTSAGAGIESQYYYTYQNAVEDIQGRGFLGFTSREVRWIKSDGTSVTEDLRYDLSHVKNVDPFVGEPTRDTVTFQDSGGKVVHQQDRRQTFQLVYDSDFHTYWTYPINTSLTEYDTDSASGQLISTHLESSSIESVDKYGHVLSATIVKGPQVDHYAATYSYSPSNWLIDTPIKIVEGSAIPVTKPPFRSVYRTTAYQYDPNGSVEWQVIEPGYDSGGNIVALPQPQSDGMQTRFIHYMRDPDGQVRAITDDATFSGTANQRVETIYRDTPDRVSPTRITNTLGHMVHISRRSRRSV